MIVLDASALVDVVLDQREQSWVLEQLKGQEVCAPAHQIAEVLSAIARIERAGDIDEESARTAALEAEGLEQELVLPSQAQLMRALDLRERIRVLDGLYVALAETRRCPLVTTDLRLVAARSPCEVRAPQQSGASENGGS